MGSQVPPLSAGALWPVPKGRCRCVYISYSIV